MVPLEFSLASGHSALVRIEHEGGAAGSQGAWCCQVHRGASDHILEIRCYMSLFLASGSSVQRLPLAGPLLLGAAGTQRNDPGWGPSLLFITAVTQGPPSLESFSVYQLPVPMCGGREATVMAHPVPDSAGLPCPPWLPNFLQGHSPAVISSLTSHWAHLPTAAKSHPV